MIVAMQETASEEQVQQVVEHLIRMGFSVHRTTGERQTVLAAVGARVDFDTRNLEVLSGVEHVHRISAPYKLAGRSFRPQGTLISFPNGVTIGGDQVVVMAGPCSVESREQLFTAAEKVSKAGARALRGGAFKPRTSPYSFQGLGLEALKLLREAGDRFGMLVISEVMEISQIAMMLPYVHILQVGARNMQNFNLLRELGKIKKPVMLKRGIAATLEELLLSAEYICPVAIMMSSCASAAFARSRLTRAIRWTSRRFPSSTSFRIGPWHRIRRMALACATKFRLWREPPWLQGPTCC